MTHRPKGNLRLVVAIASAALAVPALTAQTANSSALRKACTQKTICTVNHFTGLQSCTTGKDYWGDCDG